MKSTCLVLALSVVAHHVMSYPRYQELLPNGNNIDHPCKVNYRWPGLGHQNPLGGGAPNPFGLDFLRNDHKWNSTLCNKDSDGDGKTNGEELGDPNCTWQPGQIPQQVKDLSHPGVCDPYDSDLCKGRNDFLDCEVDKFDDCAAINRPQVIKQDLKFIDTKVPNTETNYFCMTFELPYDKDYHLIAYEPIIDNANVLHHILLYGCREHNGTRILQPESCGMSQATNDCDQIIGLWAVGIPGLCFPDDLGFRIGASGFRRVRLETHWNNPELRDDYSDASGLRLYYQPSEPQFQDLITFQTGQLLLEIPPGQPRVTAVGTCPSRCTSSLITKPAYMINAFNHMHYLGRSMRIEQFRNGQLYRKITDEDYYSYDNPIEFQFNPPIDLLPGDEVVTTCIFTSQSSNRWVYYGDGTQDEMCFGFMTVYPSDAFTNPNCVSVGPLASCDMETGRPMDDCNWGQFINRGDPETAAWWNEVERNCNIDGFCRPECREITEKVMKHPCMQDEKRKVINWFLSSYVPGGVKLMAMLNSCSSPAVDCSKQCSNWCSDNGNDGWDVADGATETTATILTTSLMLMATRLFGAY